MLVNGKPWPPALKEPDSDSNSAFPYLAVAKYFERSAGIFGIPAPPPDTRNWFRPPRIRTLASTGDWMKYLLVCEEKKPSDRLPGECTIFGVCYTVSSDILYWVGPDKIHEAALTELFRRRREPERFARSEGCESKDFEWNPTFYSDGRIE